MRQIIMPKLGLTMEEGVLARWHHREGDQIEHGEPLFEVETDKATNEVEAPFSGTLAKIILKEGGSAKVLQVVAYLLEPGEEPPEQWPDIDPLAECAEAIGSTSEIPEGSREEPALHWRTEGGAMSPPIERAHNPRISPRARKLAEQQGVPLSEVIPSGPGGRVLEKDVLAFLERGNLVQPSRLQLVAAERLSRSFSTAPHFYLKVDVDASELSAWRDRLRPELARQSQLRLTFTDLFVFLTARVLKRHPLANASWRDGRVQVFKDIHLGLAVAHPEGLVVPVIRNADKKSIDDIAAARSLLSDKAAQGRLLLEDLEGGTFTLSNLGMLGIDEFAAVINPPQSAVLAIGRIADRVVPVEGKVRIRPFLTLTLSVDHRVLDGVTGARFLTDLRASIESPEEELWRARVNSSSAPAR
jgi:pyruvate dehydrogenase E2 component (dihydrolipoamide acetyltransferase)